MRKSSHSHWLELRMGDQRDREATLQALIILLVNFKDLSEQGSQLDPVLSSVKWRDSGYLTECLKISKNIILNAFSKL